MYETLAYKDIIRDELGVMDQTAITLCRENSMPLIVLNIQRPGSVASAIRGDRVGTLVQ
jgi:Uridylate kinase